MSTRNATTLANRIDYNPDGVQFIFAYDFQVDYAEWMKVYADGVLYEDPYTVEDLGDPEGGNVVFSIIPPAEIEVLTLIREVPLTQEVVYPVYGPFPAKSHEGALDKLTWITQQMQEEIDRAYKAPIDGSQGDILLPAVNVTLDPVPPNIQESDVQSWINEADVQIAAGGGDVGEHAAKTGTEVHGLGTASTLTATTSDTDSTVGRVIKIGDFGFGAEAPEVIDPDTVVQTGFYSGAGAASVGRFPENTESGTLLVVRHNSQNIFQMAMGITEVNQFVQNYVRYFDDEGWSEWYRLLDTNDKTSITYPTDNTGSKLLKTGDHGLGTLQATRMSVGNTSQRPVSPANGDIRYNTNLSTYEAYSEGVWYDMLSGGGGGGAVGGGTDEVFWENDTIVTEDYTITVGKNAGSFGPITVTPGKTVTVPPGSVWTVV